MIASADQQRHRESTITLAGLRDAGPSQDVVDVGGESKNLHLILISSIEIYTLIRPGYAKLSTPGNEHSANCPIQVSPE